MKIKILGAYGSKTDKTNLSSFRLTKRLYLDAGNLLSAMSEEEARRIDYILITHAHLDHIADIPFLLDNIFGQRNKPLTILSTKETIEALKNHILNDKIWPEFHHMQYNNKKIVEFEEIKPGFVFVKDGVKLEVFQTNHHPTTLGFIINDETVISGDTYISEELKEILIKKNIKNLVIEISFPSRMEELAKVSKHLTPALLDSFLEGTNNPNLFIYHMKSKFIDEIKKECKSYKNLKNANFLDDGDLIDTENGVKITSYNIKTDDLLKIIEMISYEKDIDKILEMIIEYTRKITSSEGGSLYIKDENKEELVFKVVQNDKLNVYLKNSEITWPNLPLYINGRPNNKMVAAYCALSGKVIRIDDVYNEKNFDFSGTKKFDKSNNYRSKSMLVIPLKNHEDEIIGVLQLINKKIDGKIVGYTQKDEFIIKTLAGIVAVTLTKNRLIQDFEKLFQSFIKTLAIAIDKKSKHTKGHVERVAKLAKILAIGASKKLPNAHFDENRLQSIEIAGWLHDIGKITTPEYILDKSTKLESIYDRIELIRLKTELLKRDTEIKYLKGEISETEYLKSLKELEEDFEFLSMVNKGSEYMKDEDVEKVKKIAQKEIYINGKKENFLNSYEVKCLTIRKGTLLKEEMDIIRKHAKDTLEMLSEIYFPKKYKDVVHIASNHHEKLNGKGYPRGLTRKDLTLEDRIMAVADIFDALASDRPYKDSKKLSEIFKILYSMVKNNEIDKETVSLLLDDEVFEKVRQIFLKQEQIDTIDREILNFFKI